MLGLFYYFYAMELEAIHELYLSCKGVCTDTRKIRKDVIFFALRGQNFNGNEFASLALEKGAKYVVVDSIENQQDQRYITVNDVLETLQNLAKYHRKKLNIPIIALTGSNGKTTTKELIDSVLRQSYRTTSTFGNLNNHIGVPLTLLNMSKDTQIGIVEMGANHHKEIAFLCEIVAPNFGYITNFGKAHLEGFGSLDGVIKAKSELYDYLKLHDGVIFTNADDQKQRDQIGSYSSKVSFSEFDNNALKIKLHKLDPYLVIAFDNELIQTQLVGRYNFHNIAAAITISQYFKMETVLIKNGIESYIPTNNRSQRITKGSNTIILDAYNANPTSMEAALQNFERLKAVSKTVVLGDMFELGSESANEHQALITKVDTMNFETVLFVGNHFYDQQQSLDGVLFFKTYKDLEQYVVSHPLKNNYILVKGSRGMALERLLDCL